MSGKALNSLVPRIVMLAAAGGLIALGLSFRATDVKAMAKAGSNEPVSIPALPAATPAGEDATDAFTRPLFHRDRAPGPDKAPAVPVDSSNPDITDSGGEDSPAPQLKGVIIGERGGRVALQSANAAAPVWAKVGEVVDGWTVEAITAKGVRVRNGDDVADIKFSDDK